MLVDPPMLCRAGSRVCPVHQPEDAVGGMIDLIGFFNTPWPPSDTDSGVSD